MVVAEKETLLQWETVHQAWGLYASAFTELNRNTVQNHMMEFDEFLTMIHNQHIKKFLAWQGEDLVGMTVMTRHLRSWPLISVPYFEKHYPEEFARNAVFYIGFVATDNKHHDTFSSLIEAMLNRIRHNRGIGVLDYSAQVMRRGLPAASMKKISDLAPLDKATPIDAQTYVAYTFEWDREVVPGTDAG